MQLPSRHRRLNRGYAVRSIDATAVLPEHPHPHRAMAAETGRHATTPDRRYEVPALGSAGVDEKVAASWDDEYAPGATTANRPSGSSPTSWPQPADMG
jgi:hypothetical protein